MSAVLRLPAEQIYASELDALAKSDDAQRPAGWRLNRNTLIGGASSAGDAVAMNGCTA